MTMALNDFETTCRAAHRPRFRPTFYLVTWLWIAAFSVGSSTLFGALQWDARNALLTADVDHQPIQTVLKELSRVTRWQIFVDPSLENQVTTRFRGLKPADALQRLLAPSNFALIPEAEGPPTLYVYDAYREDATLHFNQPATPATTTAAKPQPETPPTLDLIVQLKPDATTSIEELAETLGAKVVGELADLHSYRLQFSDSASLQKARESLATNPNVSATEANGFVPPPPSAQSISAVVPPPPPLRPKVVPSDQQIVVALLDTSLASTSSELSQLLLPALSVEAGAPPPTEPLTHGTAMAETLYRSLAGASSDPEGTPVRILPVDIYAGKEATTTFDVIEGLLLAAANGADIINLSLGGTEPSPLLQDAVQTLRSQGVLVIAAAGNLPTTAPVFPAAYPEVLAVTAVDPNGKLADYANRGDFIDLVGPGMSIIQHDNHAYLGTGTSYASAYITGQAAAYLSAPNTNPDAVDLLLREHHGVQTTLNTGP